MCATADIWEACWHVSRLELHARSRVVSRVTEVWIWAMEFNVKSPLISQLHALTSHELTWREESVSPALHSLFLLQSEALHWHEIEVRSFTRSEVINPLNPELNPICYLLALLAHHFLHVSRIRVKSLTFRLLVSYIYGAPILDVSRSHTTTQHSR